jgi:succinate dehydrogenase / fumarate reductase, flavoprotein subunit
MAVRVRIAALKASAGKERQGLLRKALAETMMTNCSIRRTTESMNQAKQDVLALRERYRNIGLDDKGSVFNSELMEAIEVGFMIDYSLAQIESALARYESRGAHERLETGADGVEKKLPRDDPNWLKHTFAYLTPTGAVELHYRGVYLIHEHPEDGWEPELIEMMKPKERKY